MKKKLASVLGLGIGLFTGGWAQKGTEQAMGVLGGLALLLFFYLVLAGWALFGTALMSERVRSQVTVLRSRGSTCFWVGLVGVLVGAAIFAALGALADTLKKGGQEPGLVGLLAILILLALITLLLIGWGGVSLLLGEAVGRAFGRADLSPGVAALVGAILPALIGWVPLFGWALLLYWISLSIGSVFVRAPAPARD